MRRHFAQLQIIPNWTGFNVVVCSGTLVMKSNVSYLDCIDAPATEMSTIYQVKYFDSDQWYTVLVGCTNNQSISFFLLERISFFLFEELLLLLFTFSLGGIQKVRSLRRGAGVLEKQTKTKRGREVLACVYVRFFEKKCWYFQNEVLQLFSFSYWLYWVLKKKQGWTRAGGSGGVKTRESWVNVCFECPLTCNCF